MNKKTLEEFISKYNLSGLAERVSWISDGNKVAVEYASEDKNLVGFVSTDTLCLPAGRYDVFETAQLRSLLGVLRDDIQFDITTDSTGIANAIVLSDQTSKVKFTLALPSSIPAPPSPKGFPPFEFSAKIGSEFSTTFMRGSNALRQVETFTVIADGTSARVVIGYSSTSNQNSVTINLEPVDHAIIPPANFGARHFASALAANKDSTEGMLYVSSRGLVKLALPTAGFDTVYYLPAYKAPS